MMHIPGAIHHARFLASSLHILKLAILADNLPPGLVTPNMRGNIKRIRMAHFIALFHAPDFSRLALQLLPLDWTSTLGDICAAEVI